jgi:glutathione synthase
MSAEPMKIAFLVNDVDTEVPPAATTVIARAAAVMGHTVHMVGVGDISYRSDGRLSLTCRTAPPKGAKDQTAFLAAVQGRDAERTVVSSSDLDVLYLRYNPLEALENAPWAHDAGMALGQMAVLQGVIVLSHPYTLPIAVNKLYLEHFPESIRPRTVITRSYDEILRFHEAEGGRIVLKPLQGYGGRDVFLVEEGAHNLRQIVEAIARNGYVIAQEYLPEAADGDTRLFLFNGRPLVVDGKYAALRRVSGGGDFRSNMTAGGKPAKAEITPRMLEIAEIVRPRLLADGIFDAGLDIVGDRLVEINAISSGGLNAAGVLEGVDFGGEVIRLIERKVAHRRHYGSQLRNRAMAVLE